MADLVITAAGVLPVAGAKIDRTRVAGAAITAGQVVYLDANGVYSLADNNSATVAARTPSGIALNNVATGQPVDVLTAGPVTIGATITNNTQYYLSANAGAICPVADLTTGMLPASLGFAISTTVLNVNIATAAAVL